MRQDLMCVQHQVGHVDVRSDLSLAQFFFVRTFFFNEFTAINSDGVSILVHNSVFFLG